MLMGEVIQVREETLLADIERRLIDEFPCVSPAVVDALIRQEHARFMSSRIRDFVADVITAGARRRSQRRRWIPRRQ